MPPYDPKRHRRRSIRLKGYDYARPVTLAALTPSPAPPPLPNSGEGRGNGPVSSCYSSRGGEWPTFIKFPNALATFVGAIWSPSPTLLAGL